MVHYSRAGSMDNKQQIDKFREAARQVETDDDEKRFDERLRYVAKRQEQNLKRKTQSGQDN